MKTFYIIVIVGILLCIRLFFFYSEKHSYAIDDTVDISYRFTKEPKKNSYGQYFFVGNLMISLPLYPKYQYSDVVKIQGVVTSSEIGEDEILMVKDPTVIQLVDHNPFYEISKFIRYRIVQSVEMSLPPREGGLLVGIVLGVRDRISGEFYENLQQSGVLHVIAASGQNVSIIASLLLCILAKFVKRRNAILFTALGIVFYSFLTGFDPSIVRASIMAIITFGAAFWGRQSYGLYALFVTASAMIFYDPLMIEDISFQLSFFSTFGILTVKSLLDRVFSWKFLRILKDDLTTTLAAQLATIPILLASFGSYSALSVPINLLILWTVPFVMVFGGVGALVAILHPVIGAPFMLLSLPFLGYFVKIIDLFSSFNFDISFSDIPISAQIGYYLIMFGVVASLRRKKEEKI